MSVTVSDDEQEEEEEEGEGGGEGGGGVGGGGGSFPSSPVPVLASPPAARRATLRHPFREALPPCVVVSSTRYPGNPLPASPPPPPAPPPPPCSCCSCCRHHATRVSAAGCSLSGLLELRQPLGVICAFDLSEAPHSSKRELKRNWRR
ncbi:uncharacterized protein V6R79_011752 [Siganus canaliculatus]